MSSIFLIYDHSLIYFLQPTILSTTTSLANTPFVNLKMANFKSSMERFWQYLTGPPVDPPMDPPIECAVKESNAILKDIYRSMPAENDTGFYVNEASAARGPLNGVAECANYDLPVKHAV